MLRALLAVCGTSAASCDLPLREERQVRALDRRHQYRTIEVLVPPLARRLWREQTGVAGRRVERVYPRQRRVLRAERIGRTPAHMLKRRVEMTTELTGSAEADQAPERSLAIRGCSIDQHASHGTIVVGRGKRVDPLGEARRSVSRLKRELAHERVRKRVQEHIAQTGEMGVGGLQVAEAPPAAMRIQKRPLAARDTLTAL